MSKIIAFSEAASIAVHSMVLIASAGGESLNVLKISERTGASRHHVAKILQRLVKDGYLSSNRGPTGGFMLKISPDKLTLLQIYEAVEGKLEDTSCPSNNPVCTFQKCLMGNIVSKMTADFKTYMGGQTLQDFIN